MQSDYIFPPFPEEPAKTEALKLIANLETHKCIDFEMPAEERRPEFSTDVLFGPARGQMFGVLAGIDQQGNTVFLKAFSCRYNGMYSAPGWVEPCFDAAEYFRQEQVYDAEIHRLTDIDTAEALAARKALSHTSLANLTALYKFRGADGSSFGMKSICSGFPPTGTGDCCAPKLLNQAFSQGIRPISVAEFFFGAPNRSGSKAHKNFYPPCLQKCGPVIREMLGLDIVYRDEHIIVVDKQAGLPSVPGRTEELKDCAESRVRRLFPQCIEQPAVHRLDMDTSGLLVMAFTKEAHRNLRLQFEAGTVSKTYTALIDGFVQPGTGGTIELSFRLDPDDRPRQIYDPVYGKIGVTHWHAEKTQRMDGKTCTRISFEPKTGRTHQLRVHSAHEKGLGFPIMGDRLYGTRKENQRLMLHSDSISFVHPATGEAIKFTSPAPF
ncbi:MAG: RluA family pseudouridine synthase [Treponemataceae bacterium]|nr:RluA family pseudouridine synthase [Treponemataceae bacterium]